MAAVKPEVIITLKSLEVFMKFQRCNPCFWGRRIQWTYLFPIQTDSDEYSEMEIGLFQTGSSYNYAAEWDICEIPALKPMLSRLPNQMDISPTLTDNGKYPEMEIALFQTGSSYNYAAG